MLFGFSFPKSEYDIAVIETQARRPVSVKVKQFSLQGARIQNDWQGPQMVKYKNKLHPWKYIVILPVARNPIKISSPNLTQLKPVHEGIRRVLLSQQRDRGYNPNSAAPVRNNDPYAAQAPQGGASPYGQPAPMPAPAPTQPPSDPYGQPAPPPQQPPAYNDPYGGGAAYGAPPPQQQQPPAYNDPYGGGAAYGAPPPQQQQPYRY